MKPRKASIGIRLFLVEIIAYSAFIFGALSITPLRWMNPLLQINSIPGEGDSALQFGNTEPSGPGIILADEDGTARITMTVTPIGGATLSLRDSLGAVRWSVGINGRDELVVTDERGNTRTIRSLPPANAGSDTVTPADPGPETSTAP